MIMYTNSSLRNIWRTFCGKNQFTRCVWNLLKSGFFLSKECEDNEEHQVWNSDGFEVAVLKFSHFLIGNIFDEIEQKQFHPMVAMETVLLVSY